MHTYDGMGRKVHTQWNPMERTMFSYWGDTKLHKIIYKFHGEEVSFTVFDRKGDEITLDGVEKIAI